MLQASFTCTGKIFPHKVFLLIKSSIADMPAANAPIADLLQPFMALKYRIIELYKRLHYLPVKQ